MEYTKDEIIKYERKLDRLAFCFCIYMFIWAVVFVADFYFLLEILKAFDFLNIKSIIKDTEWLDLAIVLAVFVLTVFNILLAAYFVRFYPKKRRLLRDLKIEENGVEAFGNICDMKIFSKAPYENKYIATFVLEDESEVFCFYLVDKTEPLPMGEGWTLVYQPSSRFAVLKQRKPIIVEK